MTFEATWPPEEARNASRDHRRQSAPPAKTSLAETARRIGSEYDFHAADPRSPRRRSGVLLDAAARFSVEELFG
jgi:hypothetical protein